MLTLDCGHREQNSRCADEELGVQQCGEDCVAALGVETEQALRLQGRKPETRHLEVIPRGLGATGLEMSGSTWTRSQNGLPQKGTPLDGWGEIVPYKLK